MTKDIRAHGAIFSLVENTFSLHEREIVDMVLKPRKDKAGKEYKPVTRAFITGHSLGGGVANVAHLVVRAQLKKVGSPWHELAGKVTTWRACTFAALQTIVRKYETESKPKPPLMADLDESSYNVVYGCDAVSRTPGMLNFLGDCVEVVAPKIAEKTVGGVKWAGIKLFLDTHFGSFHGVKDATDEVVKVLKNKGIAEVIGQFSNVGTVLFLYAEGMKPPKHPVEYVHLKSEAAILEKLDVEGEEFKKLWGNSDEYMESIGYAHNQAFDRLIFGAKSD